MVLNKVASESNKKAFFQIQIFISEKNLKQTVPKTSDLMIMEKASLPQVHNKRLPSSLVSPIHSLIINKCHQQTTIFNPQSWAAKTHRYFSFWCYIPVYNYSLRKNVKATKFIPHHQIYDTACICGPWQHSFSSFSPQMLQVCQMTKNDVWTDLAEKTVNKWYNRVGAGVNTKRCSKIYTLS